MSVYRNIHCKLKPIHLWAIVKENPGLRKYFNRFIALLSMKTVPKLCNHCKRMENNFNMHIMLNCSLFMNERDKLLEDLLYILDVFEYVSFDLQDTEIQYLALLGCIANTSFAQITFEKWKKIIICVSKFVFLLWDHFVIDCRKI